ncbi:MAG: hydroxymethylbilane synthase [Vicinamibacterales bacterium]
MTSEQQAVFRVGTRGSALALWQTDNVIARLLEIAPGATVNRVVLSTLGDRVSDRPLPRIGDKGLFTRDLEDALRRGTIDLAVHSLKDVPTAEPDGLQIGAVLRREDPRDVVVSPRGFTMRTLPQGAIVGTSSLRRRSQLLSLRPDLRVRDIRGNVPTRLARLERGEYDAAVMAHAGLLRLDLTHQVTEVLDVDQMLPAVGQGALAVQCRRLDRAVAQVLAFLDDGPTRVATAAERALLAALEGGCHAPVAAYATLEGPVLRLRALVASVDGTEVLRDELSGESLDAEAATALGRRLAERLVASGASRVIARARIESVSRDLA